MTYKKICVIASDSEACPAKYASIRWAISLYLAKSQFKQRVFCLVVGDCFVVPPRNDGKF